MPPKSLVTGRQERLDSSGGEGPGGGYEDSCSEGHLRNAPLLFRGGKSGSADRLTWKRTGGSAGSHTRTYMLHLEEMEGGRGRGR